MESKKYRKAITYGTFDLFHIGHLELIKRIRDMADEVVIAVSTDEFNAIKGKKTVIPFEHRMEIARNIVGVDHVIPETCWEQKERDISELGIDVFVMGEDWRGEFDHLSSICSVKYLQRTKGISSTELKTSLYGVDRERLEQLRNMIEIALDIAGDLVE